MRIRDRLSSLLGIAALTAAVFAIGGGPRWAQAIVALLVAGALAPQLMSRRGFTGISPLVALLGAAIALTALQLIPLPSALIASIDPTGANLRAEGAALLDLSPWPALTRDSAGSLRGLAFFTILLGVAVISLRMAVSERGRYRVLAVVATTCGVTAVVSGIHALFGIRSLYGIYDLTQASPQLLGPLLNENHLGCLMAVGASISVGLVMYRRQSSWLRACWVGVIIACGIAALATLSRGATLSLVGGVVLALGVLIAHRFANDESPRRKPRFTTSTLPVAVVVACTVVIVLYASAGGVAEQLSRTSLQEIHEPRSKFAAWKSAAIVIEEAPWLGVGRGGFESTFTRIHPASALSTFSHVENEYVQAFVDWGLIGGIALACGAVWFVVVALRRWRDGPLAAGALGGLAVVMFQSNFDFGVELLGVAVPITAIAATLTYVPVLETKHLLRARGLRVLHIAALLVAGLMLWSNATTSLAEDHEKLLANHAVTLADLHGPLDRHPVDYFEYALAAQIMARDADSRAVRVLNHALTLHPTHAGLHLLAAQLLLGSGHVEQATIEYAAALRATPDRRKLIFEIVGRFTPALAATAIPADISRVVETVAYLVEAKHLEVATRWLTRVVELRPNDTAACTQLYAMLIYHDDLEAAEAASHHCQGFDPSVEVRLQFATGLLANKRYADAIHMLPEVESWQGNIDQRVTAWLILCDAHAALAHWDEATRCLRRLDTFGHVSPERRAEITSRLGKIKIDRAASEQLAPRPQ